MPPSDICDCPQVVLSDPQTTRLHVYHSGRTHNLRIFVLYLRGVHNLVETCAFNSSITQPRRKIPMIGCQSTPDTQAQQMSFAAHDTCLGYRLLINFEAISLLAEFRFYQYQNNLFLWSVISNKQPKPSFKQRYDVVRLELMSHHPIPDDHHVHMCRSAATNPLERETTTVSERG